MTDEQNKNDNIEFEIEQLVKDFNSAVRQALSNVDEDGFAFLTNTNKNRTDLPSQLARDFGYKLPVFKIKEAVLPDEIAYQYDKGLPEFMVSNNIRLFKDTSQSFWVKEGLK